MKYETRCLSHSCLFSFKYGYFHIQKHILLVFRFWNSGEIKKETPTRVRALLSTPPISFADIIWWYYCIFPHPSNLDMNNVNWILAFLFKTHCHLKASPDQVSMWSGPWLLASSVLPHSVLQAVCQSSLPQGLCTYCSIFLEHSFPRLLHFWPLAILQSKATSSETPSALALFDCHHSISYILKW